MALQGLYKKEIPGFSPSSAFTYAKVASVNATKSFATTSVVFLSADKEIVLDTKEYTFTPSVETSASNFIAQAYTHLKTLSEFDGYTDC
jgi:hypothetical protein